MGVTSSTGTSVSIASFASSYLKRTRSSSWPPTPSGPRCSSTVASTSELPKRIRTLEPTAGSGGVNATSAAKASLALPVGAWLERSVRAVASTALERQVQEAAIAARPTGAMQAAEKEATTMRTQGGTQCGSHNGVVTRVSRMAETWLGEDISRAAPKEGLASGPESRSRAAASLLSELGESSSIGGARGEGAAWRAKHRSKV